MNSDGDNSKDKFENMDDRMFELIKNYIKNSGFANQIGSNEKYEDCFDFNDANSCEKIANPTHLTNIIKKNSFMLLRENSENLEALIANKSSSDINNLPNEENIGLQNYNNKQNKEDDYYICHMCLKTFPLKPIYEMHIKYCVKQDNRNEWENFGTNFRDDYNCNSEHFNQHANQPNIIEDNHDDFVYVNSNDANGIHVSIHNDYEEDHHSAYDSSYRSQSFSEPDSENNNDDINYLNPNLDYEQLLQLDANVKNPLDNHYISMLITEKIQQNTIDHLAEDSKKCLICFEDFEANQKIIRLPCFHIFHEIEINHWFSENKTCPICRVDIEELLLKY
jgi:hypothetical protein